MKKWKTGSARGAHNAWLLVFTADSQLIDKSDV
jgi:hypothetical protein